ncbi:unnamed protein product [Ectocarpus sp. 6 AP-2014]
MVLSCIRQLFCQFLIAHFGCYLYHTTTNGPAYQLPKYKHEKSPPHTHNPFSLLYGNTQSRSTYEGENIPPIPAIRSTLHPILHVHIWCLDYCRLLYYYIHCHRHGDLPRSTKQHGIVRFRRKCEMHPRGSAPPPIKAPDSLFFAGS